MYRSLQSDKILKTARQLRGRINERFPESSLGRVSKEVCDVTEEALKRCQTIRSANVPLRVFVVLLVVVGFFCFGAILPRVRFTEGMWDFENFVEELEAGIGSTVFLGAAIVFLISLETRVKRSRALKALNELRALAHVIDMHQLTKDPEPALVQGQISTPSSPLRTLTPLQLSRYLDFCSELLSLIAKVGALYAQEFPDPVAMTAADEVEQLCSGLSRKIWQKIMILDRLTTGQEEHHPSPAIIPSQSVWGGDHR